MDSLGKASPKHVASKSLDLSALSKTQAARQQALDLSALSAAPGKGHAKAHELDLSALASTSGGHRASAARGPARAETDHTAHKAVAAATALDAGVLAALAAKMTRLWHPNCGTEGAAGVTVKVRILLTAGHELAAPPTLLSKSSSGADPAVVSASAQRALTAVAQGAPYTELPADAPRDIIWNFNAKQACEG